MITIPAISFLFSSFLNLPFHIHIVIRKENLHDLGFYSRRRQVRLGISVAPDILGVFFLEAGI